MNTIKKQLLQKELNRLLDDNDLVKAVIYEQPQVNRHGRKVTVVTLTCEKDMVAVTTLTEGGK